MINFKPKLPALLGALAVLTAGAAHAELLEYTFKAPDGAQRSLPPNANYANPTGNVSFALSAGIDRKVKVSVRRSDGTVVSTATSHLGVLGIFRPKTTKCSGGPAVCGLQRGITFFEIPIWALFE